MKDLAMYRPIRLAIVFLFLLAAPVAGQIAAADRAAALNDAFARLGAAETREAADEAEREVWTLWFIGPDAAATATLRRANSAIQTSALNEAHGLLDDLVADQPDFAEAWNQRAFAKFLKGDPFGSLLDIEQTLAREPRHFGALAGRARIEASLGKLSEATRTMGEVGKIHPWMARRSTIPADPMPPELGEKL
ncbi:MAG: hypothetical protein AAF367_12445 [Pseudomonadota bacterium]